MMIFTVSTSCLCFFLLFDSAAMAFLPFQPPSVMTRQHCPNVALSDMKRPILDQIASTLFKLENDRVRNSSVQDDQGRVGEPMEWSESNSLANRFSQLIQSNELGYQFKQFVADIVAGDFDKDSTAQKIDSFVDSNQQVTMFSFTSCPFCRRAKDYLDSENISYVSMELEELPDNEGNEIRAMLGRKTRRTSVPSIFINGKYIGGCNDGPGLLPLAESGELEKMLASAK
jgi:glutaredoxin 3